MRWPSKDPDDYMEPQPLLDRTPGWGGASWRARLVASLIGAAIGGAVAYETGFLMAAWIGMVLVQQANEGVHTIRGRRRARQSLGAPTA